MRPAVFALLLTAPLLAQTIEGTAVNTLTNAPLSGVKVAIEAGGKTVQNAATDAQGAFRIEGLTPGEYIASFSKAGFQQPERDADVRKPFRLTSGSPVHLDVRMTPLGKVSGRVLDASGAPVAQAVAQLLGVSIAYSDSADVEGKFTIGAVAPGAYRLWAQPPKTLKPPQPKAGSRMGWAPTFFPGGTELRASAVLIVRPGAELWDQEIRLEAVPVHRLRGVVFDAAGRPAPHLRVTLGSNQGITLKQEDRETSLDSGDDGAFEFPDVVDGIWRLSAEADKDGAKWFAFTAETMAGHDLDRVQLRLTAPFSVHGTVIREAPQGAGASKTPMLVLLTPEGGGYRMLQGAPGADGAFQIEGVHAGRYYVRPIQPGPPYYLASITMGERDVLNQYVDVTSGALPITITYKSNGGGVRGTVENCGTATVILFPQDPNLRIAEFTRRATCGEHGRFEISNIRPGDYYAFAFDRAPGLEEMFFGFSLDQGLINQAAKVEVRPGQFTVADLHVTTRP